MYHGPILKIDESGNVENEETGKPLRPSNKKKVTFFQEFVPARLLASQTRNLESKR